MQIDAKYIAKKTKMPVICQKFSYGLTIGKYAVKKKKKKTEKKKNAELCFFVEICHVMSFLKAQLSFPSNFASLFSNIKHKSSVLFLAQTLYTLVKSIRLKCKCLRFSSAQVKICQIPYVNFELTSQFLFKFCIILHCHDT